MSHMKVIKAVERDLDKIAIKKIKKGYTVRLPTKTVHAKDYEHADEIADRVTKKVLYKYARKA